MNKKLGLAVAGAVMAFASSAQAGITIPAGDWTLDIGGVVNAYYTSTRTSGDDGLKTAAQNSTGNSTENNITTGLLPNYLSVSGKSRQNDLDIAFTISIQPGAATANSATLGSLNQRQAFVTFGDASWGSVKAGKDLGIYASDAILNDMTLLGVGSNAGKGPGNTTLGRIGTGYMYADWKSQIAYTSPNWNGFQFTAGVTQAWNATGDTDISATGTGRGGSAPAFEAKASYSWTGDVAGKVWASAISQKVKGLSNATAASYKVTGATAGQLDGTYTAAVANTADTSDRAHAWDIGTHVDVANLGLTAYYSKGQGTGQTFLLSNGFDSKGNSRDSKDYYVQATYVLPTATKLGVSWGESKLDGNSGESFKDNTNEMWTVGAYHPLTKNLNLVAEYSDVKYKLDNRTKADVDGKAKTVSLGAILFF